MYKRREFLTRAVAASTLVALGGAQASAHHGAPKAARSLRFLILGGTGFIGPYIVRTAVARGHTVSVFNRGRDRALLPATVEHLVGDRNDNLLAITNRDWDAVIDDATYGPGWVRSLGDAIRSHVRHYTFISTISVYDASGRVRAINETSPVMAYRGREDPYTVTTQGPDYGALKILCEREAEKQFFGRALILRLGSVVDPQHQDEAVTYWPVRAAQGAEMMAVGDSSLPIQFIDVRDVAQWAILMAEKGVTGIFNTVGPASPTTLGQLISIASTATSQRSSITWVPAPWVIPKNTDQIWNVLLFWQGTTAIMRMNINRALSHGLAVRAVRETLADTLSWRNLEPAERRNEIVTSYKRKSDGSGWEPRSITWSAYLKREAMALAEWRAERDARS